MYGHSKRFELGRVVATPGVLEAAERANAGLAMFLHRHQFGDWGSVDAEDSAANDRAAEQGEEMILSAYEFADHTRIWIITDADRSVTTVLLPEEY